MDHDTAKKDELIGSCVLSIKDIEAKKYENYHWMNFYSSPPEGAGKYKELMDNISSLGNLPANWCLN